MARRISGVPRYLAAHAAIGAGIGVALGLLLVGHEASLLHALVRQDPIGLILVPTLGLLMALAAAATALAMISAADQPILRGTPSRPIRMSEPYPVRATERRRARINCG